MTSENGRKAEIKDEGENRNLMVIIVAAIVGVLAIVIIAMVVRMILNKQKVKGIPHEVIGEVKTGVVEVEPQFVLAADDSKNIFGRTSSTPFGNDMIENSENKKPGTGESNRRKKKTYLRKVKDPKPASAGNEEEKEDLGDDGFRNYEQSSPDRLGSPNATSRHLNSTSRSHVFSHDSVNTTRKLNNIALHRVESDEEENN